MYMGKSGSNLEDSDQDQGQAPNTMKAQAARMAASVVPTTNLTSRPSTSSAPAPPPMARANAAPQGAPNAQPSSVGPTAPPMGGAMNNPYGAAGPLPKMQQGPSAPPSQPNQPGQGSNPNPNPNPNLDQSMQGALQNMYNQQVNPQADKDYAMHQSQVDNANLMARLGSMGFGTSGAAAALSNNMKADLARQLAMLDNQAAMTNSQLSGNAINAGLNMSNSASQDAYRQSQIDAGTIAAGGYLDKNNDGKDDTTGLTKSQFDYENQMNGGLGARKTTNLSPAPFGWGAGPEGSQDKPYIMDSNDAKQAQQNGWQHHSRRNAFGQLLGEYYQDPVKKTWYFVPVGQ